MCSFEQLNEEPFTVSDDVFRVVLNDDMNKATPENLNLFNFFINNYFFSSRVDELLLGVLRTDLIERNLSNLAIVHVSQKLI